MSRIYLDSNILIAYYSSHKPEEPKKVLVEQSLDAFSQIKDVELCTSMWAVTEMVNILVSAHNMDRGLVAQLETQLVNEKRLGRLKVRFVEVSPKKDYDFGEFFFHVKQGILKFHSGVGDVIHSVILTNNGIDQILTLDEKTDFKQIPGLVVIHPRDVKL